MALVDVSIKPPAESDLPDIAALLTAEEFGEDSAARLRAAFVRLHAFSLVAVRANRIAAVALATFNGWHVFLSHLAVTPSARKEGIAGLLVDNLIRRALEAGAKGLIADARLSSVGFFQKNGFRLPGAVFLVKDVSSSSR